ncbi:PREDICTED: uncharacterized protein LOC105364727 [Ceratosolen solmsi marchali]|uniref:Uncharacterized protein LOC105364727 n=1 Tax=Ceratosolen solmsi marchali TaxID=326594 RepID=A0AAJ6YN17_9HYME|nr:PREDICTED: uncharacterized protein LOC105364727 [Ceratosolen solmsi marchali]XP_011501041.1 PREDICTED: uncharacterized protein LOC105364727 [Ceratosolen solmsi marchali]
MQSFPGQVNTTTTASTQTPPNIRFDPSYILTLSGRVKILEMMANILGFISVLASDISSHSRCGWFNTVSMAGFWTTGILLAFYLFHIIEKFYKIPWLKIEFIYCAIVTACYLLAASLIAALATSSESLGVAAFSGFVGMCLYGVDCWIKFKAIKDGKHAQGQPHSSRPVSATTGPIEY